MESRRVSLAGRYKLETGATGNKLKLGHEVKTGPTVRLIRCEPDLLNRILHILSALFLEASPFLVQVQWPGNISLPKKNTDHVVFTK